MAINNPMFLCQCDTEKTFFPAINKAVMEPGKNIFGSSDDFSLHEGLCGSSPQLNGGKNAFRIGLGETGATHQFRCGHVCGLAEDDTARFHDLFSENSFKKMFVGPAGNIGKRKPGLGGRDDCRGNFGLAEKKLSGTDDPSTGDLAAFDNGIIGGVRNMRGDPGKKIFGERECTCATDGLSDIDSETGMDVSAGQDVVRNIDTAFCADIFHRMKSSSTEDEFPGIDFAGNNHIVPHMNVSGSGNEVLPGRDVPSHTNVAIGCDGSRCIQRAPGSDAVIPGINISAAMHKSFSTP